MCPVSIVDGREQELCRVVRSTGLKENLVGKPSSMAAIRIILSKKLDQLRITGIPAFEGTEGESCANNSLFPGK